MITFDWQAGYENSLTLPKSSPVAKSFESPLREQLFTSVPSAPSDHIPIVSKDMIHVWVAHSTSLNVDGCGICRQTPGFPAKF